MEIGIASSPDEIDRCHPVMAQLRPHVEAQAFRERVTRQIADHRYVLAYVADRGEVRAVAGFRMSECLAWGRFMYVDDLVTADSDRSRGYGQALFEWLVDHAKQNGCEQLHLDSGVQRFGAHRFYLRHGMDISSHHFTMMLDH
jgi:GNAT superfamily N-acetyltransferase